VRFARPLLAPLGWLFKYLVKYSTHMSDKTKVSRITKAAEENTDPTDKDNKRLLERSDTDLQARLRSLRQFKFRDEADLVARFQYDGLTEDEGVYEYEGYVVLDQTQVKAILTAEYKDLPNTTGRQKFVSHLRSRYIGISNTNVTDFLKNNDLHQLYSQRHRSSRAITSVSSGPFKVIMTDITYIEPVLNMKYLLVLIDQWSKYIWVKLLSSLGATVATAIKEILLTMPTKQVGVIRSDNGSEFKNSTMTAMLKDLGVKQYFATPGLPTSSGTVEVANKHIKEAMYSILHDTKKDLPSVQDAIAKSVKMLNETVNKAHGFMPSALNKSDLPEAIVDEVNRKLASNAEQTAPNARFQKFLEPGSKIRITLEELDPRIQQQIKAGTYKASHNQTYSSKVFTVRKQDTQNRVAVEGLSYTFSRGACLLVPDSARDLTKEVAPEPVAAKGKRKPSQTDSILPTRKLRSAK
jgi:transposase InsO family protein